MCIQLFKNSSIQNSVILKVVSCHYDQAIPIMSLAKEVKQLRNYINGAFYPAQSGGEIQNFNPAIGSLYSYLPDSSDQDVDLAVKAAERAFPAWSALGNEKRSRLMLRVADLIEQHLEEFAQAETEDTGKPISLSRSVDIPRAASNFRFFAHAINSFASESHSTPADSINYTLRQPIGVVGCISPWNLPLYLFTWKIAPALATGNCVIGKPSEVTPKTAYLLSRIFAEAGFPNGVINILHGLGQKVGKAMVEHPGIKAISFTGGTETGQEIARIAAPKFKKLSLELGGKNPNIIFDDCDFNKMLSTTVNSSFRNQGQICLCGSRIYVQRGIYEKFKTEFTARTYMLKVGDPLEESTDLGAVVSENHFNKILYHINLAKEEGGVVLSGGKSVQPAGRCRTGWFIEPTIIEGLDINCQTNQKEIFGPVVTITPFDTEAEALEMANHSKYGLSCTIWTSDLSRAHRMAEKIESGVVWINCWMKRDLRTPFGGMKQSGVGREGGMEVLRFFTEPKNVCIAY